MKSCNYKFRGKLCKDPCQKTIKGNFREKCLLHLREADKKSLVAKAEIDKVKNSKYCLKIKAVDVKKRATLRKKYREMEENQSLKELKMQA